MGCHFTVSSHQFAVWPENKAGISITIHLFIILPCAQKQICAVAAAGIQQKTNGIRWLLFDFILLLGIDYIKIVSLQSSFRRNNPIGAMPAGNVNRFFYLLDVFLLGALG